MRQHITTVYTFDELPEAAQRRAWESNTFDLSDAHNYELHATLAAFEDIFDIKVYRWRVDDWSYSFDFVTAGRATECPEGDALRLARYIWNNYADAITKGKFYCTRGTWSSGQYHYKTRYSRVFLERDNCPLTGVCYDYDILKHVNNCLEYKEFFETFDDLITACLDSFFRAWRNEIEYCNSFEYFAETAAANDWEFTASGDFWRGAA